MPGGGGFTRSICLEEFQYNEDGSILRITRTVEGVKPIEHLNPFIRQEAETIAREEGIETERSTNAGVYVTKISNGDFIKVRSVDFKKGAGIFQANASSASDQPDLSSAAQGYRSPKKNCTVYGRVMTIAGQSFQRGFGTYAESSLFIQLDGKAN